MAAGPASASDRLQIVASFSVLGDMVRQVTGDLADVTTIVGPMRSAHLYQPNTADAKAVAGADIVFVNGLGFETWSDFLIGNAGGDARVVAATGGVEPLLVDGEVDPHAWNALTNGIIYVENIAAAMVAARTPSMRMPTRRTRPLYRRAPRPSQQRRGHFRIASGRWPHRGDGA